MAGWFSPTLTRAIVFTGSNPKVLLSSTNTWTAAQTFSSATFSGDVTITGGCTGCGGSGVKEYDLVIGTQGTPNVDVYVTSTSNFNLALASVGVFSLLPSTAMALSQRH